MPSPEVATSQGGASSLATPHFLEFITITHLLLCLAQSGSCEVGLGEDGLCTKVTAKLYQCASFVRTDRRSLLTDGF